MPRLTCTRDQARSKIEKQVQAGEVLRTVPGSAWSLRYESWDTHNKALLKSLFDDPDAANEYGQIYTKMPPIYSLSDAPRLADQATRETYERRLNWLSSFEDRLELYEEPSNRGQAAGMPVPPAWIEWFHPEVQRYAGPLVAGGHFAEAIRKAAQHLHNRVRDRAKQLDPAVANLDGVRLITRAFGDDPLIPLTPRQDKSQRDEHDGLRFLFMGAIAALRNPRAHETDDWVERDVDPVEVFEWLGLISALHRALDKAPGLRTSTARAFTGTPLPNP